MSVGQAKRAAGDAIVARARALVGTRFRLQGRCRSNGMDCVGAAAAAGGVDAALVRRDYPLRGTSLEELERELIRLGLQAVGEEAAEPGDIAVFAPGPAQLHLGVFTGSSLVHADAGLGRVVERPLPPPWPLLGFWRFGGR
jgi:cell wall-associated NlpC family hydrolase